MMRLATIGAICLVTAACGQGDAGNESATPGAANGASPAKGSGEAGASIAEGLAAPEYGRLAAALKAAGLEGTLSGAQPYTIFAPTDAAFQKLEGGDADALLASENKAQLVALLTGHIVPGLVTAEDLGRAIDRGKGKAQIATVGGGSLTFTRSEGSVEVAGPGGSRARVGDSKLQSNGAIHPVDAVLMPR
jgi:uncharacterized surface protein with fasciclin (FAS1) repeats